MFKFFEECLKGLTVNHHVYTKRAVHIAAKVRYSYQRVL